MPVAQVTTCPGYGKYELVKEVHEGSAEDDLTELIALLEEGRLGSAYDPFADGAEPAGAACFL